VTVDPTEIRQGQTSVTDLSDTIRDLPDPFYTKFNRKNDLHQVFALRMNRTSFGIAPALTSVDVGED
jgi:hypothetical protein